MPLRTHRKFSLAGLTAIGLPLVLMLPGSRSALALDPSPQLISQAEQSTPPDVIIDSDPQGSASPLPTSTGTDPRFSCQIVNGEYTVVYHPESQPGQAYPWAIPRQLGGGWTENKRCNTISQRLESYRPDGLQELKTSVENNYNIICVTTQKDSSCRIVLTVPPGQDAEVTRDLVFQNLTVADSGQQTQGVNTFAEGNSDNQLLNQIGQVLNGNLPNLGANTSSSTANGINLKPFLDPADGGTGTQLRKSKAIPANSRQLNPDRFR